MRYYNTVNAAYLRLLGSKVCRYTAEIELLDVSEKVCGVVKDIISGTVNHSYSQGICRTCSITLPGKYSCSPDSPFWINRKFKILIGISGGGDTFVFSHGVFTVKEISENLAGTVTVEGVDKFTYFTGDIGSGILQGTYYIGAGAKACDVVRDILTIPFGNGEVIDSVPPDIDVSLYQVTLPYEISVNSGEKLGKILTDIATAMRADIFYSPDGVLTVYKALDKKDYIPSVYDFDSKNIISFSAKYDLSDIVNQYTVIGKEVSGLICRYTAENRDPISPICIQSIGLRAAEPIENESCYNLDRCRDYAEYMLSKKTVISASGTLTCRPVPHISSAGIAIAIMHDIYVISSVSIPIGSGEMTLSVCNKDNL